MKKDAFIEEVLRDGGDWFYNEEKVKQGRMTQNLYPYEQLFSPITINGITIKNRVVMAPMGNISMCDESGRPNDQMLQYFFQRAKGGVGLITTGLVPFGQGIDPTLTEIDNLSYFPRIDRSRTVFAGWRDLAVGVHNYGSKIFIQLTPGLGRVGNPQVLLNKKKFPISASLNPNFYMPQIPCLPLSDNKLRKLINRAGQAAADAQAAGIDGVYLHGHEGYLLEQMTNRAFNRRKLGPFSDWQRFGIDMVAKIRQRVGLHYPIMYRIDLSLAYNETYGEIMNEKSLRKFKDGRTVEQTLDFMVQLVKAGVDVFDVDLGGYDNWWLPHPPASVQPGCYTQVSQLVKDHFIQHNIKTNAKQEVVVVAVGKLGFPDLAESVLRNQQADMIMLGRPLLADPDWCNKAVNGQVKSIIPCIGCQEGCINEFVEGGHPQCAVNPRTSFEYLIPENLPKAITLKKIGVVGAGPAGVMAAIVAAKRGHQVTLIEKSNEVGGKIIPGSIPKIKFDLDNYRQYLNYAVMQAELMSNFTFLRNQEVDLDWLASNRFDALILANGAKEVAFKLPNMELVNVIEATELLKDTSRLKGVSNVVVIGGGIIGCETAYWLHYEYQCKVKVMEMDSYFMRHICTANRGHLIHYLQKADVELYNCTKVVGFGPHTVKIERNVSKTVPNPYNTWQPVLPLNVENPLAITLKSQLVHQEIPCDLVVLAIGNRPDNDLYYQALKHRVAFEIYSIGDNYASGKVHDATRSGFALGQNL